MGEKSVDRLQQVMKCCRRDCRTRHQNYLLYFPCIFVSVTKKSTIPVLNSDIHNASCNTAILFFYFLCGALLAHRDYGIELMYSDNAMNGWRLLHIILPLFEGCFPFPIFVFCASLTSSAMSPLYVSESCCKASLVCNKWVRRFDVFDVCIRRSARCRSSAGRGSNGNVSEITCE